MDNTDEPKNYCACGVRIDVGVLLCAACQKQADDFIEVMQEKIDNNDPWEEHTPWSRTP